MQRTLIQMSRRFNIPKAHLSSVPILKKPTSKGLLANLIMQNLIRRRSFSSRFPINPNRLALLFLARGKLQTNGFKLPCLIHPH